MGDRRIVYSAIIIVGILAVVLVNNSVVLDMPSSEDPPIRIIPIGEDHDTCHLLLFIKVQASDQTPDENLMQVCVLELDTE